MLARGEWVDDVAEDCAWCSYKPNDGEGMVGGHGKLFCTDPCYDEWQGENLTPKGSRGKIGAQERNT